MGWRDRYRGRVALVAGGTSGIGFALARGLAQAGARVVISSRSPERVDAAVAQLAELGVVGRVLDVRDREAFRACAAEVSATIGAIDYLLNSAGITVFGEARDHTDRDWDDVIDIDLRGAVNGVLAVYPDMIARRTGHIVNVASLAGLVPTPGAVAYTAAKCGVVGMSDVLRMEARTHGVRVSVVCPAAVDTPIAQVSACRAMDRDKFLALVPGSLADPDAFARKVLRGIARNKAVIAPGPAGVLHWLHRHTPWLSGLVMRRMVGAIARVRAASTRPTLPPAA